MTHWTDERVVARLADTFAAHESDADPEVARRIALTADPARRRQWPVLVAAAASVVVAAGVGTFALHATGSKPAAPADHPPTVDRTPTTEGTNRDLAIAAAGRVLGTFPVPPGSTESDAAPTPRLRHLGAYIGPVDPSLTETSWWVVPLSYGDLVAWYDAHSPANTGSAYADPDSTSPVPEGDLYWETRDPSAAYSSPAAVVSYARLDAHTTAVRTDVTLAARYDRTAETLVPSTVTSIDITRSAIDGPREPPTTATLTDPALLGDVGSAFNNLAGAFADATPSACGSPVGIVFAYAVTFHWPGHTLAVDPGAPLCGIGRGLTLDGTELPQSLEEDGSLDAALQAALDAS
jgi:hypothetical protein